MTNTNAALANNPARSNLSEFKIDVSGAAYEINGILKTCILACDPMATFEEWKGDTGLERTLMVAERMMGDLIERIEVLESSLRNVSVDNEA